MSAPAVVPNARNVASAVLVRVFKDDAFASAALESELERAVQLDPRDRALATELVYGTLRAERYLDQRIGVHVPKGVGTLDVPVRVALLVAAYQLLFLQRIPGFAAVDEAVGAIRRVRGAQVGGFVNAVLRKIATEARTGPEITLADAIASTPVRWLSRSLTATLGDEGAAAFLRSMADTPPVGLRAASPADRERAVTELTRSLPDARIEAGEVSRLAIRVAGAGRVADLPGVAEGRLVVQEEGSQVVGLALGAREGERVLDACAGRGNKTSLLAAAVGPSGAVDACDLHPSKLERLRQELEHLGLAPRSTFAVDWSRGCGDVPDDFDAVLVDAPCSGTGTLRRRPEIVRRRSAEVLRELAALQTAILGHASSRVRPGGRLVYAVCSVLAEEGDAVVDAFLAAHPEFEETAFADADVARVASGGSRFRLLPHVHGTDGYFAAHLTRRR